ncbi:hypothetical protein B0H63DRAFT_473032 [Podospora didyma]|uniref:Uncharacterized protein n=1 Tax=Podospora didyma TaxID=330526 RepID=A0AAE0NQ74_9PEZI|nr:hypothetical protein B0H63DRAFT_473032 [Podospora didyma]
MFHVKSIHESPPCDLDLEIAKDEVFTANKFRAHIERFYMTVAVGLFSVWKHIARLRSWREWQRTSVFLGVYAIAWFFDCLLSAFLTILLVLAVYPPSRALLFPHAPAAMIDGETGGVKKPMAGVLASDSMTGAPETYPGEAIEMEAHSFVNSIIEIAIAMSSGQNPEDIANAKDKTGGSLQAVEHDKTKKPVSDAVWEEALPVLHTMAGISDTYERFGNALSPTYPFSTEKPRRRIVSILVPLILGSYFLTAHMIFKGTGLIVGLLVFGDPIIKWAMDFAGRAYPQWQNYTELRNTVLKGIPTNAQLALTLLRIGERNQSPLPPPPHSTDPLPMETHSTAGEGLGELLRVDPLEINDAMQPDAETKEEADGDLREQQTKGNKTASRAIAFVKHVARGGVHAIRGADRVSAHVGGPGSKSARYRAGVVKTGGPPPASGPTRFLARFDGKKGYASIVVGSLEFGAAESSFLGWTAGRMGDESEEEEEGVAGGTKWAIEIADIHEIQKTGGLGWKSKILVGWATDEADIMDGVIIRDKAGHEYHLTAIPLRDALFNRLISVGGQMWESW